MMKSLLLIAILITLPWIGKAQTLIMNEVSQGTTGNMEYIEFVVIDTTVTYDCTSGLPPSIDVRGWIIDDNSGYHGAAGVAPGCIRFSFDPLWSNLPLGTVIVVYNDAQPEPSLPANDLTMADGNCLIVAPISDVNLFESNATTPGAVACSYPAAGWTAGGNWNNILLANTGDCARIVDLGGCEQFSVCWGTANLNTQIYFGGGAGNTVFYFDGVDPDLQTNWLSGCTDNETILDANNCGSNEQTPGMENTPANAAYIASFNNGCTPIPILTSSINVDSHEICGCDGQATASGAGSIGPYTYTWTDALYAPIGQTSATATGLCAGDYNVIVESSIGCLDTTLVTINPGSTIPTLTLQDTTGCSPFVVDLTDVTYWNTDVGVMTIYTDPGYSIPLATMATAGPGLYFVEAVNGGCNDTGTITVTEVTTPTLTLQDSTGCVPFVVDLTNTSVWNTDVGAMTFYTDPGYSIPLATPTAAGPGTYYVEAVNGICSSTGMVTLTENPLPVITAVGADPTTCNGTDGSIEVTLSSGPISSGTLDWTGTATGSNPLADITADSPDIITLGAGSYNVTFTDANGCISNTEAVTLLNPGAPIIDAILDTAGCVDYTLDLSNVTGTNLTSALSFYSETGGPAGAGVVIPDLTTFAAFTDTTIYVYDQNGVCSHEIQYNVTINAIPTLTLQDTTDCAPFTVDLTNTSVWSSDVGTLTFYTDPGHSIPIATPNNVGAGTYYAQADNSGCTALGTVVVTEIPLPIIDPILDTIGCVDYTLDLTNVTGTDLTGALSFYSETGGPAGSGVVIPELTTFAAFTDTTIYVYDENGACNSEVQFNVTVNTIPTLTLQDTVGCSPFTVDLTNTLVWSTDVGTMTFYTDPGYTLLATPTTATSGTYYVQAVNATCISTGTVTLTENTSPVIDAVGSDPTVCNANDGSIEVTLTSGATSSGTLDWTGTATGLNPAADITVDSPDIATLTAGNYNIIFTDANGCVSNMMQVGLANPNAPLIDPLVPLTACDSVQLPAITGTDLTANVGYWTGMGATGTQMNVGDWVSASTTIYAYDSTAVIPTCWDEEPLSITVNITPVLDPVSDTIACGSYDLPVQITGTNLTGGEAYYDNSQASGGVVISGTLATSQTVYIYDGNNGCSDEVSFNVTIDIQEDGSFALTDYCEGDPNSATVTGTAGGSFTFEVPVTDGAIIDAGTGEISNGVGGTTYGVMYTTNGNCPAVSTQAVQVFATPVNPSLSGGGIYCENSDIPMVSVSGSGGTFDWYDNAGLTNNIGTGSSMEPDSIIGLYTYYVQETSVNGCVGPINSTTVEIQPCGIVVPSAFTPNADLIHDDWEIDGLDQVYPNNTVTVFNRWGSLLFQHNSQTDGPYDLNRWDGTFKGKELPVASYYYIIEFNNEDKESISGTVTIVRRQ